MTPEWPGSPRRPLRPYIQSCRGIINTRYQHTGMEHSTRKQPMLTSSPGSPMSPGGPFVPVTAWNGMEDPSAANQTSLRKAQQWCSHPRSSVSWNTLVSLQSRLTLHRMTSQQFIIALQKYIYIQLSLQLIHAVHIAKSQVSGTRF